jgi:uncharacterized protein YjbJ (UPF0337 family)
LAGVVSPFPFLAAPYIVEPIVVPHVDDVVVPLPIIICPRRFGITDRSRRARRTVIAAGQHNSHVIWAMTHTATEETSMDKDRIKGSAEQAKGAVKAAAGKILGDSKLEGEGKAQEAKGKVQNALGGLKDTLRGK